MESEAYRRAAAFLRYIFQNAVMFREVLWWSRESRPETEREWERVRGKKWKFHTKGLMQAQKASVASNIVPCIQALYLPQRILRVKLSHARKHWTRFYICAKYCVVFRISSNANNKNITIISIIIHILHGCASASNEKSVIHHQFLGWILKNNGNNGNDSKKYRGTFPAFLISKKLLNNAELSPSLTFRFSAQWEKQERVFWFWSIRKKL